MVMIVLRIITTLIGVETTTLKSSMLTKCAALVTVVIGLVFKMKKIKLKRRIKVKRRIKLKRRTKLKKRTKVKRRIKAKRTKLKKNKMIPLSVLTQILIVLMEALSLMVLMAALSTITTLSGVEATTPTHSFRRICAAFVVVVALVRNARMKIILSVLIQMFSLMERS